MSYSDHTKPVGHCTICNAPVYLIKNQIRRVCTCATANCGNTTHTLGTITALLYPPALTDLAFPQISTGSSTVPLLPGSTVDMYQPEEDHSGPAQREFDPSQKHNAFQDDEVTPERARRIYGSICLAMRIHRSCCSDCDMLAIQGLMCPTYITMNDGRLFWSKRLPEKEAYSA